MSTKIYVQSIWRHFTAPLLVLKQICIKDSNYLVINEDFIASVAWSEICYCFQGPPQTAHAHQ